MLVVRMWALDFDKHCLVPDSSVYLRVESFFFIYCPHDHQVPCHCDEFREWYEWDWVILQCKMIRWRFLACFSEKLHFKKVNWNVSHMSCIGKLFVLVLTMYQLSCLCVCMFVDASVNLSIFGAGGVCSENEETDLFERKTSNLT